MNRMPSWLLAGAVTWLLAACGGEPPTPTTPSTPVAPGAIASVSLAPLASYVLTADTLQLSATLRDAANVTISGRTITWSSSANSVATVTNQGRVLPVGPGVATITATSEGKAGTATVSVNYGRGVRVPTMMAYDSIIPAFMARYRVPGASVAVMRNGKLVFARGYGYADTTSKALVDPTSLFRIASVTKTITSAATMKLVEQGALSLDAKAFTILSDIRPANLQTMDPRLLNITIRQLLTHSAGWDRDISGDPMFMSATAANATGTAPPAPLPAILKYWMSKSLDFAPGFRYAYSNLGFAVLGLIIERVSGQSYESFVKSNILALAGTTRMQLGHTLPTQHATGEVQYYDLGTTASVFPGGGTVAWPNGGFYLEPMAAHGGWISSAPDLLRFAGAVDGFAERPDILSASSLSMITAKPSFWAASSSSWYGFGWSVNTASNWWHNGSLPGTSTLLVRTSGNVTWAVLLNSRTTPAGETDIGLATDSQMWVAFGRVSTWPTHDLFDRY